MSMYEMVCGMNVFAGSLLQHIGLEPTRIPRPRDVWINKELTEVTVMTRTGGGNREQYQLENQQLVEHPNYLRDKDADWDATYAEFVFKMPETEKIIMEREVLEQNGAPEVQKLMAYITKTGGEKFQEALVNIGKQ